MVNEIIARLKEGTIKNVVLFSDSMKIPPPPYVVVKPETGLTANTRQYRIIIYHQQGMFNALEKYTLVEMDELLGGYIDDKEGGRFRLHKGGYTDITAEPEGNTFFMERIYTVPLLGNQ